MTQTSDPTPAVGPGTLRAEAAGPARGPVKEVRLLLPVWGEPFIVQFLRISLPTLLAPGNLPAIAAVVPCTFVFLTDTEGASLLREHPATAYLRGICQVEFDIIDDLITGENYSTTLTLGYARAMRSRGLAMCDTCFFFLISDYIMADGSLRNVLARVQSGYNGVLAGNFQVVEEDAKEPLFERFETGKPSIVIAPRDLMSWGLNYLHPMTLANTVNFPVYFSTHSNRLFWRVDENTLIGRFYLMHMIAIRPEVTNFEIGSSCDYSFIPEMCPSGNVHVVADSDEYLVVEMQRRAHEEKFIRLGAVDRGALAKSLGGWTTARHRINARSAVIYRAGEASAALPEMIEDSRLFIEAIESRLPAAQPYRNHPYWVMAIAAHRRAVAAKQETADQSGMQNNTPARPFDYHDFLYKLRDRFFGRGSQVRPWHPRWPDYRMIERLAKKYASNKANARFLMLSSQPAAFGNWPKIPTGKVDSISIHTVLAANPDSYERFVGCYDGCFLALYESELPHLRKLLMRISPMLRPGDHLVIFIVNGAAGLLINWRFNQDILRQAGALSDRHLSFAEAQFVPAGWSAWTVLAALRSLFGTSVRNPFYFLLGGVPMALLMLFSLLGNVVGRWAVSRPSRNQLCSSVGIAMRVQTESLEHPGRAEFTELELAGRRFEPGMTRTKAPGVESV
jgi:hypothetical protein